MKTIKNIVEILEELDSKALKLEDTMDVRKQQPCALDY